MKRIILNTIIRQLEIELARLDSANQQSSASAAYSAPHAEKQRDTTGLEASYLAHGYSMQCNNLAKQIEELKEMEVEDFTGQEIDVGALVEVDVDNEIDCYMLLNCGGGTEVIVDERLITVITPESPLGSVLMGNVEAGCFSLRAGTEGIILNVS